MNYLYLIIKFYFNPKKVFVSVLNFQLGLEWIWNKNKFMERKAQISEYYLDFKDDGIINKDKFKNYDPFFESPDTVTQIGTAIISLKSLIYLTPFKSDFKIIDLRCQQVGTINIEIIPANDQGKPLSDGEIKMRKGADMLMDWLNLDDDDLSFIIKINSASLSNTQYEDIFCQFQMYSDNINVDPSKKGSFVKQGFLDEAIEEIADESMKALNILNGPNGDKPTSPKGGAPPTGAKAGAPAPTKPQVETKMIDFKTSVIKGTNNPKFNYSQPFFYRTNKKVTKI